jgi:hypothetical protein
MDHAIAAYRLNKLVENALRKPALREAGHEESNV